MSYQAYLDSVKEKTGMSPDDFTVMAEQKGLLEPGVKAGTIVAWLKDDFGLGHGHAMAIYGTLKSASAPKESDIRLPGLDAHIGTELRDLGC